MYAPLRSTLAAGFVPVAAEWFLDNFHLVTGDVVDIRRNLPRTYYRELPRLAVRQQAGDARVYAMATAPTVLEPNVAPLSFRSNASISTSSFVVRPRIAARRGRGSTSARR